MASRIDELLDDIARLERELEWNSMAPWLDGGIGSRKVASDSNAVSTWRTRVSNRASHDTSAKAAFPDGYHRRLLFLRKELRAERRGN